MTALNALLRPLFDTLLSPMRGLPPIWSLTVVSLATAVGMLLVFKATSDQKGIAAVKRRIHACLFEIRLFNDDLLAILRAQLEILRHNLTYLRLNLVPLAVMIVPLVLVIAQLQFHYGYRGLEPGQTALVKVRLADGWDPSRRPEARLDVAAQGVRVETPAAWFPAIRELTWRVAAASPGDYQLTVALDGATYSKSLRVSGAVARRSPERLAPGFFNQLLYPAEDPLPAGAPVESIAVTYPDAAVFVLGWEIHWLIVFFVLSIVFAYALKKPFGVTL